MPSSLLPHRGVAARVTIVVLTLWLTALGVLFIHSATAPGGAFPSAAARNQILKAALALAGMVLLAGLDYRLLDRTAYVIYGGGVAVLAGMLAMKLVSGSGLNRFIEIHRFQLQIQPSELMKIALILGLARFLRYREDQRRLAGFVLPFAITLPPMALVLLQPDLGTSLMFPPVLLGMLYVAGARRLHLAVVMVFGLLLLPAAYLLGDYLPLIRDYQRERITAFVRRDEVTRRHEGFQLRQSEIAIGSGGLLGKGYAQGTQNRGDFVPERHTDFIFSVIGEELGFAGAAGVGLAYLLLVAAIFRVALETREPFGRLAAVGIGVSFAAQSFENLAMTVGLTPITGLPLPFVSLGGSSLVTSYLAVGIVLGIGARRVRVVATQDLNPRDRLRLVLLEKEKPAGLL